MPYYGKNAVVDTYLADGIFYSVDVVTQDVVEIQPEVMNYRVDAAYTEDQLRRMAETMIAEFLGDKVKLDKLSFSLGQKIGTYFFRWEDTTKQLDYGGYPFIQVGLSQNGDFLNFYNTLPFGRNTAWTGAKVKANILQIGPFNEIYANGGAYWQGGGGSTPAQGGWYYYHPERCSGAFCSVFYYAPQSTGGAGLIKGNWWSNYNKNTRAAAFIPYYNATAVVTYYVYVNDGTSRTRQIDQNAFYDAWALLTSSTVSPGINGVNLNNYGTTSKLVAWDEIWVYNP